MRHCYRAALKTASAVAHTVVYNALLQSKPELSGLCYRASLNCQEAVLQSKPRADPKHC